MKAVPKSRGAEEWSFSHAALDSPLASHCMGKRGDCDSSQCTRMRVLHPMRVDILFLLLLQQGVTSSVRATPCISGLGSHAALTKCRRWLEADVPQADGRVAGSQGIQFIVSSRIETKAKELSKIRVKYPRISAPSVAGLVLARNLRSGSFGTLY